MSEKEELRRAKASRGQCKGVITKMFNLMDDKSLKEDLQLLQVRRDRLLKAFEEYCQYNVEVEILDPTDKENFDEIDEKYCVTLSYFNKLLDPGSPTTPLSTPSENDGKGQLPQAFQRLPRINIEPFTGSTSEYYPFINLFNSVVHENKQLSDCDRLYYLNTFLKGEALDVIKHLPLKAENYKIALDLIKQRYDNKVKIITHHVNQILELPNIGKCTSVALRNLISNVKQHIGALKNLGQPTDMWDTLLVCALQKKLDIYTVRSFYLEREDSADMPTLDIFLKFLDRKAAALETVSNTAGTNNAVPPTKKHVLAVVKSSKKQSKRMTCKYCDSNLHRLYACQKFKLATPSERIKFINDNKYCKVCLNDHEGDCRFKFKCTECKENHNTLLHLQDNKDTNVSLICSNAPTILLPTALVKIRTKSNNEIVVRAVLDSASQVSFVLSDLIDTIDCKTQGENNTVLGVCESKNEIKQNAKFSISSCVNNYSLDVTCSVVDKITSNLPQFKINRKDLNIPKNIQLADPLFDQPAPIAVLLACDVFFQVLQQEILPLKPQGPFLVLTRFGHIVAGALPSDKLIHKNQLSLNTVHVSSQISSLTGQEISDNVNIQNELTKFWETEKVPECFPEATSEHERAELIFKESVKLENNRFQVALPLKQPLNEVFLGDSLSCALQRFYNLEKRLMKDPSLYEKYREFIRDYIACGHAELVDISKYNLDEDPVYFLPHHPVFNDNSKTTKMRTVFDGSMKTKKGISLNDALLNGPNVQNELFDILLLFRLPKYILISDIKQMFRQCLLDPEFRPLVNILWRENVNDPIMCLQLKTVTYGLKCSSFLATRCLLELALRFHDRYPLAADILKHNTYVDDIQTGDDDIDILLEKRRQLIELLKLGSFELHKWCANDQRLLADIPIEKQNVNDIDMSKQDVFVKTLGLKYNVKSDTFYISCPETDVLETFTKRQVLSFISKFFDPLGLVGPIFVSSKIMMQKIWASNISWDTPLPTELNEEWKCFAKSLIEMSHIKVDRHINVLGAVKIELIGFADASNLAYGCCLYLRIVNKDGSVNVYLLCSKSRVNPINKELTTPRLELNSALLLSILVKRVHDTLKLKFDVDVYLYLDSQIVLAWLKMEPMRLQAYVANRIKKIQELAAEYPWFYVKTSENPADCISRGIEPHCLQSNDLWWYGPDFLKQKDYVHINQNNNVCVNIPELKKGSEGNVFPACNLVTANAEPLEFFTRFSCINKMKRIMSYVLRFCHNCKSKKEDRLKGELLPSELDNALITIIKYDQHIHLVSEILALKTNKPINGSLRSLSPFLDSNDVLRVGGRLQNSELPYSQRHPIILVKGSRITYLIIAREHEDLMHAGPKLMLCNLNQRFWLINGLREIKHVIHKCVRCFRLKAKIVSQLMGSLPADRVQPARPFEKVGIDYAGPFNIKFTRVKKPVIVKGYIVIFVCFVVKAIHIELVSDMTTETFLNCFKRFIARRNKPSLVFCDNAATLRSANTQLQELYKLQSSATHQSAISNYAASQGIQFKFIPAYSPEFAGLWEAGVKSVKYHLKRAVGDTVLTYEEFNTVIIQIEAILNSRPLTPMSSDSNDLTYLTPGHFLTGAPMTSYPEPDVTNVPSHRLTFWKKCTQIQQAFFKQWHKQYLTLLQNRPKWKIEKPNVLEGMLVILKDDNVTPLKWPMGRIVNVHPGRDGLVRAVDVKTKNGHIVKTSIRKICVLPIHD